MGSPSKTGPLELLVDVLELARLKSIKENCSKKINNE